MTSDPGIPDFVPGDATGIPLPVRPAVMRDGAEAFLTRALRAYGTISSDNRVTAVTRFESFAGGNSGRKLALSVEYQRPEPGLSGELFAKFSRDLEDPFRDRRRYELEPEIKLAALSRHPEFPIRVARPVFADFHHDSGTGLLITERIAIGEGNIEPLHPKCMDHELDDPLPYYRVLVAALARLTAAHHSGRLSPDLERLFPYDAEATAADWPIPQDEAALRGKVEQWARFARDYPQLMTANLADPAFYRQLESDMLAFQRHEAEVRHFLHADPRFIALCHWNSNIDNAWFWRDNAGDLHCGLLDWGMVRHMNVGYSLWGGLSASDHTFVGREIGGLLRHFIAELRTHGGPLITPEELDLHFDLSVAMLGLGLMLDTPALVSARTPNLGEAHELHDPVMRADPVTHGFLHVSTNFLNLWQRRDFGASLRRMLNQPVKR